jgi:hypothetical protein
MSTRQPAIQDHFLSHPRDWRGPADSLARDSLLATKFSRLIRCLWSGEAMYTVMADRAAKIRFRFRLKGG